MYIIICKRQSIHDESKTIALPIMEGDDEGEETGNIAQFKTLEEAQEFTYTNILCSTSTNIIIDLENEEIV